MNPEQKKLLLNEYFETGGKYYYFANIARY